ncbi:hypothetical protein [Lentzea albidocapillata]|uniref:Peptidoglycan/LPS O-acetylase OafA/YrhL, contains acyltransferase and SGNH-hydrolase domains n=1 Tax=Lentzea albidocapillata TaxID=40571 RepID=A0A1W2FHT2_9PSEU|nr:hypothetical protein [Lentzea albidocapillata]SMD21629.1 hypothetical protein SAMN05660733_06497 [Lentzea albidocapillata]
MSSPSEQVTQPVASSSTRPSGLRAPVAVATVLIAYSFLGGLWLNRHGYSPEWLVLVREWFNKPLGLGEDFGFLAIALLLMSCGHLLVLRVTTASPAAFARRLAWQVLPAAVIAVVLGLLFSLFADPLPFEFDYRANPLVLGLLAGLVFAVLLVLSAPLLPRQWHIAVVGQLAVVTFALTAAGIADAPQLGILASLVVLSVIGELLWLSKSGIARFWEVAPLVLFGLSLLVVSEHLFREARDRWFTVAAVTALLLMLLFVRGQASTTRPRPVEWLFSRGYYLVLLCGVLAYPLVGLLQPLTLPVSYIVVLLAWGLGAELLHRWFGKST